MSDIIGLMLTLDMTRPIPLMPHIRRMVLYAMASWSLLICVFYGIEVYEESAQTVEIAMSEARARIEKNFAFRQWASSHGGVYVPVDASTQPNVNLAHIPERDIKTPSGRQLTLMNPAYMMRQLMTELKSPDGSREKITSLKPIWEGNAPDRWEAESLRAFERGVKEASALEYMDGRPYMRLMRPFITVEGCLKCHAAQGYKAGDVRGALSVSIPISWIRKIEKKHDTMSAVILVVIWILGLGVIRFGGARLSAQAERNITAQRQIEAALKEKEVLLSEVHHRVKNNMAIISSLIGLQASRSNSDDIMSFARVSQNRIRSMALIHEKLYRTKDFSSVDLKAYVEELILHHRSSYAVADDSLQVRLDIDDIRLPLDTLIPVGLILNELISNSLSHPFVELDNPRIHISIRDVGGTFTLHYSDNGEGLNEPVGFSTESSTLGLQLIMMLTGQIGGTVMVRGTAGAPFTITFPLG